MDTVLWIMVEKTVALIMEKPLGLRGFFNWDWKFRPLSEATSKEKIEIEFMIIESTWDD